MRQKLITRIRVSEKSRGKKQGKQSEGEPVQKPIVSGNIRENASLYAGMQGLNRYYVHNISHQILAYCLEKNIKVLGG